MSFEHAHKKASIHSIAYIVLLHLDKSCPKHLQCFSIICLLTDMICMTFLYMKM